MRLSYDVTLDDREGVMGPSNPGCSFEIANAGLVIAAPFLPELFTRIDLTETRDSEVQWRSDAAAERGALLLQMFATGSISAGADSLALNKVLCGLSQGTEVPLAERNDSEAKALDELMGGMLAHWSKLQKTSAGGLRESFLKRSGRLELHDECWRLTVEREPFDMLLDSLPWSFSSIQFDWMPLPLVTNWL